MRPDFKLPLSSLIVYPNSANVLWSLIANGISTKLVCIFILATIAQAHINLYGIQIFFPLKSGIFSVIQSKTLFECILRTISSTKLAELKQTASNLPLCISSMTCCCECLHNLIMSSPR